MGNTHDTEIARIEADYIHTKWRTTEDYRWGYYSDRGPETWWIYYPSASGGMQSPIDILTEEVTFDPELCQYPLQICYLDVPTAHDDGDASGGGGAHDSLIDEPRLSPVHDSLLGAGSNRVESIKLTNTGNSIRIDIVNSRSYITGGPCRTHSFVLDHVSVHWGEDDSTGSEHLVNSQPSAAEVHFIHWNEDLYDSYEEACKREDGIVAIAVFVKVSDERPNKAFACMSNLLEDIAYRNQSISLPANFDISCLMPEDMSRYWTYKGSFTTPPCYETVTWIIFHDPIATASQHLAKLRELRTYSDNEVRPTGEDDFDGRIGRNYRPQQPIGTRKVFTVESDGGHDMYVDGMLIHGIRPRRYDDPFRSSFAPRLHTAFRRDAGRCVRSRRA